MLLTISLGSYPLGGNAAALSKHETNGSWAGYEATPASGSSDRYSAVNGEFMIPRIKCDPSDPQEINESFSQWVGIDGVSDEDLVQDGVEVHCVEAKDHTFHAEYYPWWEVIQGAGDAVWRGHQFAVQPGDKIQSSVEYKGGIYTLTLQNETTGAGFKKYKTCYDGGTPCERSSAEWIIERPRGIDYGGVLAVFDTATFTNATARVNGNGTDLNLLQLNARAVDMFDYSVNLFLATTAQPGKDYQSFSIHYKNHGTTSGGGH
jgi:hypothetical protein